MSSCSLKTPCENNNNACELHEDQNTNVCIDHIPDYIPISQMSVFIHGKPFTGNTKVVTKILQQYFSDIQKVKCNQAYDSVTMVSFEDRDLNELRELLTGEDILGFYNLETGQVFCEVASSLFKFWKTQDLQQGVLITASQVKEMKEKYPKLIEKYTEEKKFDPEESAKDELGRQYTYNRNEVKFVSLSPILPIYVEKKAVQKIMREKNYFYLVVPTNMSWFDRNRHAVSVHHNFFPGQNQYGDKLYVIIPVGAENRKELIEGTADIEEILSGKKFLEGTEVVVTEEKQPERKVREQKLEDTTINAIKTEIMDVLKKRGAVSRESSVKKEELISSVRNKFPDVRTDTIEGFYAWWIGQRKITQTRENDKIVVYLGSPKRTADGQSFFDAIRDNNIERVTDLLTEVDVNNKDEYGNTALAIAMIAENENIVELLLKHGANVNNINKLGDQALIVASEYGNINIIKLLLKYGANIDAKNKNENTALMLACANSNTDIVELLLEYKATVDIKNKSENTALILSCIDDNTDIVNLLLKHGANINNKSIYGNTPLMIAIYNHSLNMVKLLLKHNANVNVSDNNEVTPLMLACKENNIDIIKLLLKRGANINYKNKYGITALRYARAKNNTDAVNLLLERGALI